MANPRLGPRPAVLFDARGVVTEEDEDGGGPAPVRISVNPRARRPSLRIDPMRREAVLTVPGEDEIDRARQFAYEQSEWVRRQLARLPPPRPFLEGAAIPVRGADHELKRPGARGTARLEAGPPARLLAPGPKEAFSGRVRRLLVREATSDFTEACERHAAALGVRFARLTVKDTTSRWGSCSSRGTLSFSWRIVCAPPMVLDYLAAHEVAHLREPNHSARFWRLVDSLTPVRAKAQRWLHREGPSLFAVGALA
ncbi:MAG: M48 family metallopeptidase [Caulobacterales bacterium]|nr:M48 family metallopeptidase [Caulobacterales bacterium]